MSEILTNPKTIKDKPRSRKLNPKIDLSAMVSVSFLLIVFFMVNAEMSKPQVMNLGLPTCREGNELEYINCGPDERRVITLLLDDNNKIIFYHGLLSYPIESPKILAYGKEGIRKKLMPMNDEILKVTGDINRKAIVIIKPSRKSNYGNLVDILDEMAITNINTYAIVNEFTPEESKLLASR
jgi:biopolymer transport protein ExbD